MTPNWAGPVDVSVSPRTATRVTPGAICLSNSSHFPLMLYSKSMKPVALPPRPRQAVDEPAGDWIGDDREQLSARCGLPAATALRSRCRVPE